MELLRHLKVIVPTGIIPVESGRTKENQTGSREVLLAADCGSLELESWKPQELLCSCMIKAQELLCGSLKGKRQGMRK